MKKIHAILLLALAAFAVRADDLPLGAAYYTVSFVTNIPAGASGWSTNVALSLGTNKIENNVQHTFYFNSTTNEGTATFAIDFSGDGTNFVNWANPVLAASGPNVGVNQFTNFFFKQSYYRIRLTSTNYVGKVIYLGGR